MFEFEIWPTEARYSGAWLAVNGRQLKPVSPVVISKDGGTLWFLTYLLPVASIVGSEATQLASGVPMSCQARWVTYDFRRTVNVMDSLCGCGDEHN